MYLLYTYVSYSTTKKHLKITGIFGGINDLGEGEKKRAERKGLISGAWTNPFLKELKIWKIGFIFGAWTNPF